MITSLGQLIINLYFDGSVSQNSGFPFLAEVCLF